MTGEVFGSRVGRRMFLRGAASVSLAIPFLSSLEKRAHAGDPPYAAQPRFVAMGSNHGGVWSSNIFPGVETLTDAQTYRGFTIRRGTPTLSLNGSRASLSRVLTGDASKLTPSLLAKMNLIQGLNLPYYVGHQTGAHLGNYARNDGNGTDGIYLEGFPAPTIDQQMAWSPSFYPDLTMIKERSLAIGTRMSYVWSDTTNRTGDIQEVASEVSSLSMFNRIFVPSETGSGQRKPVVDRVLENYNRLRNGNRRLSSGDKKRLDEHMDRIAELQRKLTVKVTCDGVTPPTLDSADLTTAANYAYDPAAQAEYWGLMNDVIVAAFTCGTSRIATMHISDTFSNYQGDWHQDIAHQANQADGVAQAIMADGHQGTFEGVFLDLVSKLDAVQEADGITALDNTLVQWTHECGVQTHYCSATPLITAGSAGGVLKTGNHVDYRNLDAGVKWGPYGDGASNDDNKEYPGPLYHQWLANVLDVMGIPASDWAEYEDNGGYGKLFVGGGFEETFTSDVTSSLGEKLPWLR